MMEKEVYIHVLKALAEGCNPETGEMFSHDSPYNQPMVIRALYSAINDLQAPTRKKMTVEEKQAANVAKKLPVNYGLKWTEEDRAKVGELFSEDNEISSIANVVGRTVSSIISELEKQGFYSQEQRIMLSEKMKGNSSLVIKKSLLHSLCSTG